MNTNIALPTLEEATASELLDILPLLIHLVATEVKREAGNDTTMPQFRVLGHLADGPLTLSVLARRRRVSLQSMGELVQTLVERGWLERKPDPTDRRQQLIGLTPVGRRHFVRAQTKALQRLTPLMATLSAEELAAVRIALAGLHRVLLTADDPASTADSGPDRLNLKQHEEPNSPEKSRP